MYTVKVRFPGSDWQLLTVEDDNLDFSGTVNVPFFSDDRADTINYLGERGYTVVADLGEKLIIRDKTGGEGEAIIFLM